MKTNLSSSNVLARHLLPLVLASVVTTRVSAGGDQKGDMNATNQHTRLMKGLDRTVTNNLPQWVAQIKTQEKGKRLKGASNLFVCSLIDPERMKREEVGDQIAAAYEQEEAVETKMAMLATLDMLGHPSLSNLLAKAAQSDDPLVRNLVTLIKEKRYLEPVVVEDPDIKRSGHSGK